jgi:hypothetical protein
VIASEPANETVDVPITTAVFATFSEPIDPYTLDDESFTLAPAGGDPVSALVSYDPDTDTVTLVPDSLLAEDTLYEARLTTAIRDVAGNALAADQTWSFTTEAITVDAPDRPAATALLPSYPNPFNPATTVRFDLARAQRVEVRIYGIDGRRVRTLVSGELPAGRHERSWNGRDEAGHTVATGMYLLRLATDDDAHTHKLTMLK